MLKLTIAGRLGKNAEHKTTQGGTDICQFSVACDAGWGDNKTTYWVDVSKFGKGAEGLSRILKKGDPVAVIGDLTTREYNGKTYLQCRADDVTLQGSGRGERKQPYDSGGSVGTSSYDDLDDDIPFD